jgi:hypothetical protein
MADTTRLLLPASMFFGDNDAQLVAGDLPARKTSHNSSTVLVFDDTDEEAAITPWLFMPSQYAAGTLKLKIGLYTSSDATNDIYMDGFIEATTPDADTLDLEASTSWDSANTGNISLSGSTAGDPLTLTITLTNKDSIAAGDKFRIGIRADVDHASHDIVGDFFVTGCEFIEVT